MKIPSEEQLQEWHQYNDYALVTTIRELKEYIVLLENLVKELTGPNSKKGE